MNRSGWPCRGCPSGSTWSATGPSTVPFWGIGHLGTGDLEVRVVSAADLEKAAPLIRRAFEAA